MISVRALWEEKSTVSLTAAICRIERCEGPLKRLRHNFTRIFKGGVSRVSLYLRYIHDKTGNNPVGNLSKENARSDWFKPARQKPALLCTCLRLHDHSFIHSGQSTRG